MIPMCMTHHQKAFTTLKACHFSARLMIAVQRVVFKCAHFRTPCTKSSLSASHRLRTLSGMPDAPASSDLRSAEDNTLVSRSKIYNEAFATKDLNRLSALFAPKVIYHADEVSYRRRHIELCRWQQSFVIAQEGILTSLGEVWSCHRSCLSSAEGQSVIAFWHKVHKDAALLSQVTLRSNVSGREEVLEYIKSYFGEFLFLKLSFLICMHLSSACRCKSIFYIQ